MEAKELSNKIFEIKDELEKNEGIVLFVNYRIKMERREKRKLGFEPWLKVEICGILSHHGKVEPEKYHSVNSGVKKIDIIFGVKRENEWAISLKDIITNVNKLKKELERLEEDQYIGYNKTCLVFLTFWPSMQKNKDSDILHYLIDNHKIHFETPIKFKNGIDGRIWFVVG